jgi:hypothetical protein
VAYVLIGFIVPPTHRAPLQPPQTVETTNPQVCVHTDLKDEVDEWKIQQSLQLVRELGAPTIVEYFPWAYFESEQDTYNWHQADRIVRHAQNQGIRIIARLGLVPGWARPEDTTLNYIEDDAYDEFAAFVVAFVSRYAGTIDHVIIWNEPNLAFEWGYQPVEPRRYVRMLETVYAPAKAANPNLTILAGALAPTLEPPGSAAGMNDLIYLANMYAGGAADYFDALAVHSYGLSLPADAAPGFSQLNFRRVEMVREIMVRYGDADTPVFITESGWNDDVRWAHAVRPSQRLAYTLDAFRWAEANADWVANLCIWVLRYPRPTNRYPDGFTLVTPEFQLKPIYFALQDYARGWGEGNGATWLPAPES